jgi:hypothetical protein
VVLLPARASAHKKSGRGMMPTVPGYGETDPELVIDAAARENLL